MAEQRSLEETPTWSVAVVCFVLVAISIAIEHLIHEAGKWLMKRQKPALYEAMEKVKNELMLLGFISLLLTVLQNPIADICVPMNVGNSWHPCKRKAETSSESEKLLVSHNGRRLLNSSDAFVSLRRVLAGGKEDKCALKGKVSLISNYGIHQLHIFIFVLAIFHILYCILTLALGRLKMKSWKAWENETKTAEYQFSHDPERFRFTRDTSFGRQHLTFWSNSQVLIWIVCFFRQFFRSVSKVDYLTLRHGFIMAHLAPQSSVKFDFQKYINRSLEEDFKVVAGISPVIWFFAVLFLLFNTHGWFSYLWLPFIPLIIILLVGTKLRVIITQMAVQIMDRGDVIKGVPVVQPTDNHFWFNRPQLLLNLIHFVLFQNAFQLAFFVFSTYKFGINSCFHEQTLDIVIRISMGILIQILCSYVTLPLYALVTQMGSNMKPAIFNERVAAALRKWHQTARKHVKENRKSGSVTPLSTSRPATPTHRHSPGYTPSSYGASPVHLLRYYQNELDSAQGSPRNYISDADRLDIERSLSSTYNYRGADSSSSHHHRKGGAREEQVDGDKEIQLTGDSEQPGSPSPATETKQAHVAIDFSFDRRRML